LLIFHVPTLSFADPNILFNIFLSDNNFHFTDSFSTHVSLTYVIAGLTVVQQNFNLVFFDTNLLLNIFFIGVVSFNAQSKFSLISYSMEFSPLTTDPLYLF